LHRLLGRKPWQVHIVDASRMTPRDGFRDWHGAMAIRKELEAALAAE